MNDDNGAISLLPGLATLDEALQDRSRDLVVLRRRLQLYQSLVQVLDLGILPLDGEFLFFFLGSVLLNLEL